MQDVWGEGCFLFFSFSFSSLKYDMGALSNRMCLFFVHVEICPSYKLLKKIIILHMLI